MTVRGKARGRPFQPGNPGRPAGSKNKVTHLIEQLADEEAERKSVSNCSIKQRRATSPVCAW
jgi:hypothetical protein